MMQAIRTCLLSVCSAGLLLTTCPTAYAQAWLPLPGEGSFSLAYQHMKGGDHLFSEDIDGVSSRGYTSRGKRWNLGDTQAHSVSASLDYGIFRRLAASASATYVTSRYMGNAPITSIDDQTFNGTLQDGRIEARYQLLGSPVIVTPSIGYTFPLADYAAAGHSSPGGRLKSVQFTLNAGRLLDPIIPNAYIHGRYAYTVTEKVKGLNINASNVNLEIGYFPTASLSVRGLLDIFRVHGGLDWISRNPDDPCPHCGEFAELTNQVSQARYTRLGFGTSYSLPRNMDVFATWSTTLTGANLEDSNFLTFGTSWSFRSPFVRD